MGKDTKVVRKRHYFGALLGVLMIVAGMGNLVVWAGQSLREKSKEQEIRELLTEESEVEEAVETDGAEEVLPRLQTLYERNQDLVGWISIEGTRIDYPVMQNEDDSYYLYRGFDQEEDRYGCLFVKQSADIFTPATNFVIYGHNMKDGAMFGTLKKYREESYYREHPMISFDTLYEERTYEILSVFQSQVYDENEDAFKYYEFTRADTEEEFNDFYDNIKKLSLYDTEVEAEYGDTFLTLSTCDYRSENGRFVIVAKELSL